MSSTPCKFDRKCHRADCYFFHPNGRLIDEQHASSSSGTSVCRYDRNCTRKDCYFSHPNGRNIDQVDHVESDENMMRTLGKHLEQEDAAAKKEHWFPKAMDCECCKGYIFGCKTPACVANEICKCSAAESEDLPVVESVSDP